MFLYIILAIPLCATLWSFVNLCGIIITQRFTEEIEVHREPRNLIFYLPSSSKKFNNSKIAGNQRKQNNRNNTDIEFCTGFMLLHQL